MSQPFVLNVNHVTDDPDYIAVSQSLLYAVRTGDNAAAQYTTGLKNATERVLKTQLSNDAKRKAFWLNVYNAYVQWLLKNNPGHYKDRNAFFTDRQIVIAGRPLSLDDMEHGILRHSKIKWGFGLLNKIFTPTFEKNFRVDTLDYRIHFALNCGAKSCPPIAYYSADTIDRELDLATKNYLENEVTYEAAKNAIHLPAIMSWFREDFGGKDGMLQVLKKYTIIQAYQHPSIHFKSYDWTLFLTHYKEESHE